MKSDMGHTSLSWKHYEWVLYLWKPRMMKPFYDFFFWYLLLVLYFMFYYSRWFYNDCTHLCITLHILATILNKTLPKHLQMDYSSPMGRQRALSMGRGIRFHPDSLCRSFVGQGSISPQGRVQVAHPSQRRRIQQGTVCSWWPEIQKKADIL